MEITTRQELDAIADGTRVTIVGRYERWRPDPFGPEPIRTARVVLADRTGVLLGRYATVEILRDDGELERCAGGTVRATGTYYRTKTWDQAGPMPGFWTGGGPQLTEVTLELV